MRFVLSTRKAAAFKAAADGQSVGAGTPHRKNYRHGSGKRQQEILAIRLADYMRRIVNSKATSSCAFNPRVLSSRQGKAVVSTGVLNLRQRQMVKE